MTERRFRTMDGGERAVAGSALEKLASGLRGRLIVEGDRDYEDARKIWNAMIDKRPAVIARCMGAADVIDTLRFARDLGLVFSIRGGGHNIAGNALNDGGVVIDLSTMKGARVDPAAWTASVEPGCTLGDVDRETQAFGTAVPAGIVSTTGVAGLTLGGGFGWLTRKYGYTCDHLVSADVVTAEGRLVRARPGENADLLWGLRGGGGNFGIVTSFEFRLQPVGPEVAAGMVIYPMDQAERVARFFHDWTASAPDEVASLLIMRPAPAAPFLPPEMHGKPIVAVAVCHSGSAEEGSKALRPVREFGSPLADVVAVKPFSTHQKMLDAAQPPGRLYYWKSEYMRELGSAAADVMIRHAGKIRSPHSSVLLMHLGGAMSRVGETDTAAAHRDARYILNIAGSWDNPAETPEHVAWARDFWSDMRRFSTGGVYVNFLTSDEGDDRVRAAYGPEVYERLQALKGKYDPSNLFRLNQNVSPSAP